MAFKFYQIKPSSIKRGGQTLKYLVLTKLCLIVFRHQAFPICSGLIYIFAIFLHVITFFCQTEMETVDVLRLAQLHNQTDRVYHEMNSKEKVNT